MGMPTLGAALRVAAGVPPNHRDDEGHRLHSQGRTCSASTLRKPEMAGVTMAVWEKRLNLPLVVFQTPADCCKPIRGRNGQRQLTAVAVGGDVSSTGALLDYVGDCPAT